MITDTDRYNYKAAKNLAFYGEHRVRVGAVATLKGRRIAGAFNTSRNQDSVGFPHQTRHAEYNLIRLLPPEKLDQITIYVARIDKYGLGLPSQPCARCLATLNASGIKYVCYFDGEELVKDKC